MTRFALLLVAVPLQALAGVLGPAPAVAVTVADRTSWVAPLAGPIDVSRAFRPPETRYGPGHRGVDLRAPEGAVVRAAGAGRVSFAGVLAGRGVVAVVHGELRTTYEPVAAGVSVGDRVAAGAPIGLLQRGHPPCRSCLHWGLRRGPGADATYLDPLRLLARPPSVLLPLTTADRVRAGGLGGAPARATGARPPTAAPAPAPPGGPGEGGWALRAADLPLGAGAVLALVAGVALLVRRPVPGGRCAPDPDDPPVAPALAVPVAAPDGAEGARPPVAAAGLVDLRVERVRRREPGPAAAAARRTACG